MFHSCPSCTCRTRFGKRRGSVAGDTAPLDAYDVGFWRRHVVLQVPREWNAPVAALGTDQAGVPRARLVARARRTCRCRKQQAEGQRSCQRRHAPRQPTGHATRRHPCGAWLARDSWAAGSAASAAGRRTPPAAQRPMRDRRASWSKGCWHPLSTSRRGSRARAAGHERRGRAWAVSGAAAPPTSHGSRARKRACSQSRQRHVRVTAAARRRAQTQPQPPRGGANARTTLSGGDAQHAGPPRHAGPVSAAEPHLSAPGARPPDEYPGRGSCRPTGAESSPNPRQARAPPSLSVRCGSRSLRRARRLGCGSLATRARPRTFTWNVNPPRITDEERLRSGRRPGSVIPSLSRS